MRITSFFAFKSLVPSVAVWLYFLILYLKIDNPNCSSVEQVEHILYSIEARALPTLHEVEPFLKHTASKNKFLAYVAAFVSSLHIP